MLTRGGFVKAVRRNRAIKRRLKALNSVGFALKVGPLLYPDGYPKGLIMVAPIDEAKLSLCPPWPLLIRI